MNKNIFQIISFLILLDLNSAPRGVTSNMVAACMRPGCGRSARPRSFHAWLDETRRLDEVASLDASQPQSISTTPCR
jgi:hypothetical protein